jgi:hypothetical protein
MSSVNARKNSAAGVVTLRRTALPQCLEESRLVLADVLPRSIFVIVDGEALPDDSRQAGDGGDSDAERCQRNPTSRRHRSPRDASGVAEVRTKVGADAAGRAV